MAVAERLQEGSAGMSKETSSLLNATGRNCWDFEGKRKLLAAVLTFPETALVPGEVSGRFMIGIVPFATRKLGIN